MLEEHEWSQVKPFLVGYIRGIHRYREQHGASLAEATAHVSSLALQKYFELTGFRETNFNALRHHRASDFGSPCDTCGKPLRTPRAKLCAECGAPRA